MRSICSLFHDNNNIKHVIKDIETTIHDIDEDKNGTIDFEEFVDFLAHYDLDAKLNNKEKKIIFDMFIDEEINNKELHCNTFISALVHVITDHPNFGSRRAVYRVCRRVFKSNKF